MDFIEAIKEMRVGKKVRRDAWCDDHFVEMFDGKICWCADKKQPQNFDIEAMLANDWEVFEEKTLSDKREKIGDCEYGYSEWNVKEALEEFRLWFKEKPKCYVGVEKKMKELFGEGLIK